MASLTTAAALAQHSILVVDPVLDDILPLVIALSRDGLHVTVAAEFSQAKQLLISNPPSVLLAAVRLGLYNGLHLVVHGTAIKPDMAVLVLSADADPLLQLDAESLGATFMVKPIGERDLFAVMLRTLYRTTPGPIRSPFERRTSERRVRPLSVSPERRGQERRRFAFPVAKSPV